MSNNYKNLEADHYSLEPGFIYLPDNTTFIASSLGSSVLVSIYDNKLRIGGLSHFQYPVIRNKKKYTARYGNIAVLTLINMFFARGSKKKDLEAQIFGGAHRFGFFTKNIGMQNIELARKVLKQQDIRISSEDVGGEKGRKVVFNTSTNEVAILKINELSDKHWYPYKN
ncbi:putative chemoreceptor glutamine deamidase CheD 2 [Candidatus Magnetomoraceae bacterium gMMP-15]